MFASYYSQKFILQEEDKNKILDQILKETEDLLELNSNTTSQIETNITQTFSALQTNYKQKMGSKPLSYEDLVDLTISKISKEIKNNFVQQNNYSQMFERDYEKAKVTVFDHKIKTRSSYKFDSSNRF